MNLITLLLAAAAVPSTSSLLGMLLYVAIFCVVIWAIYALIQWSGIVIPPPIRIIAIALICILIIFWLFRAFGVLA